MAMGRVDPAAKWVLMATYFGRSMARLLKVVLYSKQPCFVYTLCCSAEALGMGLF
jgi:hypothetical protein